MNGDGDRVKTEISIKHLSLVVWCICFTCILSVIWIPDYLPFTDYPVHLSLIQVSGIPGQAAPVISDAYQQDWFTPYSLTYYLGRMPAALFSLETTGKILLSIYLLMTPLIFRRLLILLSKPGDLALASIPLLLNFNVSWGFLPFLLSIPLILESLVRMISFTRSTNRRNFLLTAIVLIILFFTHLFGLLIALALIAFILIARTMFIDHRAFRLVLPVIPVLGLVAIWRLTLQFSQSDAFFLAKGFRFASLTHKFKFFPTFVFSGDPGWFAFQFFIVFLLILLLRALPVRKTDGSHISMTKTVIASLSNPCWILFIGISFIYLICPYNWLTAVWLFNRLAFFIPLFGILLLPSSSRMPSYAWSSLMVLLICWFSFQYTGRFLSFSQEAARGIQAIRQLPPGQALRYIPSNPRSIHSDHEPYEHFGHYYQHHQNGCVFNPFAVLVHLPIRYTDQQMNELDGFSAGAHHVDQQLTTDLMYEQNQYFLIRLSPWDSPDRVMNLFSQSGHPLPELIYTDAPWILLRRQDLNL